MSKESVRAFGEFKESLINPSDLANGDIQFSGNIEYDFNVGVLSEDLVVTLGISTSSSCNISLAEGNVLNSERVHMEFKVDFQDYSYSNGVITISGQSPKLGDYVVKISELV
ncbi:MAG: hypothetical protein WC121_03590 [Candidatus Kapaibacterium sp.]|jgi:hypothetical protein